MTAVICWLHRYQAGVHQTCSLSPRMHCPGCVHMHPIPLAFQTVLEKPLQSRAEMETQPMAIWQSQSWACTLTSPNTPGSAGCQNKPVKNKSEAIHCFSSLAGWSFLIGWIQSYLTDNCKDKYKESVHQWQQTYHRNLTLSSSSFPPAPNLFSFCLGQRFCSCYHFLYAIHKVSACRVNSFGCYF